MKIMHIIFLLAFAAILGSSVLYACPDRWRTAAGSSNGTVAEGGWMGRMASMRRHHYAMKRGLPDSFQGLDNPLPAVVSVLAVGQHVYEQNCSACHGDEGRGDGPAADSLSPRPANLRHLMRMPMMASDAYLFWTIAEGGEPVDTDMPAFRDALTTEEIWSAIQYIRQKL
jgi:mono/diheme cytochrome c family protein